MEFDFRKQPGLKRNEDGEIIQSPLISIITPYYNAGKYFEQTYNCVMNQTFCWFEWIIVNDGSTCEADVAHLQELVSLDKRVALYHIKNSGPAAARNYAVSKTKTELIVSLDADDLIEPTYLEKTFFALYFHPDAAWAYTDSLGFEEMEYVWKVPFDSEKLKKRNFLIEIGTFRKRKFYEAGGYDDAQKHSHEDWNLWLRFMARGGYPIHIASLEAWYRILNNGALHKTNDDGKTKKRAYERIKSIACQINDKIEPIEYPRITVESQNLQPKCSDWSIKKRKTKTEVLMLVSELKCAEDSCLDKELIVRLSSDNVHVGVAVTEKICDEQKQFYSECVRDLYELPAFLDVSDYAEFLSYYIISRQVDFIIVNKSTYGYYLIPWLKTHFPNIRVMEVVETGNVVENNYKIYSQRLAAFFDYSYQYLEENIECVIEKIVQDIKKGDKSEVKGIISSCSNMKDITTDYVRAYNHIMVLQQERKEVELRLHPVKMLRMKMQEWNLKRKY